jgi:hypothetical protein
MYLDPLTQDLFNKLQFDEIGKQMTSGEHFKSHNLRGEILLILKENLICDMK